MKQIVLRLLVVFSLCISFAAVNTVDVNADQASWSLRYIKGAPTSEYKTSWKTTVTTTRTETTMSVTKISGGAQLFIYTSNGISTLASTKVTTSVETKSGLSVYASVSYNEHGTATNYPSGTLTY